jgi:hypothetical protein
VLVCLVAIAAGTYICIRVLVPTQIDDAFITLTYVRTLGHDGTWGMFPDRVANTATSPLNVLLTAAVGTISLSAPRASALLTSIELTALLACLLRISHTVFGNSYFGLFAFVGLATNPLLVSTLGLEGFLFTTLFVASILCWVTRRWWFLGVSVGLLTLARPDGALLFPILFAFGPRGLRPRATLALAYMLTLLPWSLFSWIALGSLVPDTLIIKTGQRTWGTRGFVDGLLMYSRAFPLATLGSFLPVMGAVGFAYGVKGLVRPLLVVLLGYGVLYFASYALLGVPPYHWYYVQIVVPCVLLGALGAASWISHFPRVSVPPLQWLVYSTAALPALALVVILSRDGVPPREAPIHTNWASPAQYRAIGVWLREHVEPASSIRLQAEIGTLAYYSERYLVNNFSDRGEIEPVVERWRHSRRVWVRWLAAVNYYWRRSPPAVQPAYVLLQKRAGEASPPAARILKQWDTASRWTTSTVYLLRGGDLP